jgi:hypothetical protein
MHEKLASSQSPKLFITLVAALTLAACASGSSGKTGAGGSGGSGGSGGAGGSTGGTGGSTAGTSGGAGSDGGMSMDAPPAPELNSCGDPAKLGAATPMNQMGSLNFGDRSTTAMDGSVVWFGDLNMATRPQKLDVQLYRNAAPFGAMLAPMTINLAGQSDFSTCGACVLFHPMYNDGVEIRAQPNYIATSGMLNITAVPNGAAGKFTATLSNVTFEHVMIASSSFMTTKLDNCTITLTSASIDVDVP